MNARSDRQGEGGRRRPAPRWLVVPLLLVAMTAGTPGPGALAAEGGMVRLDVTLGKSQVVELKEAFSRVSVTNPGIADVFVVTPNQILVNGKASGTTSLVVFYPMKTLFFDVVVQTDMALLKERLRQIAPRGDIDVQAAQEAIILSGTVPTQHALGGAGEVASVFAPKGRVVNLLTLNEAKPQQVLLQVHVAEATRESLRELGFSVRAIGSAFQGGMWPGRNPFTSPLGALGAVHPAAWGLSALGQSTPDFEFGGGNFFLSSGQRDYAGIVRALAERNLLRILAKPNLVTQSGKEARFLSGGEFPYPVAQELNRVTVEFKEFGVGLVFTPEVTDGETIHLKVRPEVSSLDFTQGLQAAGFRIPVVRKNQAATTVNIKDGESFAIAGLINNEVRQVVSKIPLLGDIPVLGALFRSTRFQNNETELLFLVTVKLVKPTAPGSAAGPDPNRLMDLRDAEKKEFTLMPGFPGIGEVVEQPLGQSNLPTK